MVASEKGHLEVVRALLAAKADVNVKVAGGITASMLALQNGHLEVMQLLKASLLAPGLQDTPKLRPAIK